LKGATGAGVALSASSLLAACGSSSSGGATTANHPLGQKGLVALPGGTPRRGGTFTVGVPSTGSEENLFPGTAAVSPDYVRDFNMYNFLFYVGRYVTPVEPGLALSAEPSKGATVWTFHLRPDVMWHDGKPFTSADVVYNFTALWSNPNDNYGASFLTGLVDFKKVRARDKLTVEVPLTKPMAQFPSIFTFYNFAVVQNGATKKSTAQQPIGTGPFKYESFKPGSQSVFTKFDAYWEEGKPYVDKLVVNSSFTDPNSIENALLSGQIDLFPNIPLLTARSQLSSKQVQILQSPIAAIQYMFLMRIDKGPFVDNRVRTAFKLLADRGAMVEGTFVGFGEPAYDLLAPGTEYFLSDLKRERDVEQAKSLLKQAGALDRTYVLPAADVFPGMVAGATLFAQQAQAAGVNVVVKQQNPVTYFTPAGGFLARPFGYEIDQVVPSLTVDYLAELTADCPYPDTHWGSQSGGAASQALIQKALSATERASATELWRQCQMEQYNEGGYLIWGNVGLVDAAATNVRGLQAGSGFNYNNWRLCDGWLAD
jgi:peptide/nickel transport system substrate-binding protein